MPDPVAVLRRAIELLEEDGSIIVTVPAHDALWTSHDVLNHHYRRYTKARFAALAERAGARPVRSSYFFHWLAPVKLGVRFKEAFIGAHSESPHIPPRWMNRLLRGMSSIRTANFDVNCPFRLERLSLLVLKAAGARMICFEPLPLFADAISARGAVGGRPVA